MWRIVALACLVSSSALGAETACLLPSQKRMILAELFFGRDIEGRAPLADSEWSEFVARVIAKEFPDGFTVHDGEGEWLDSRTHRVVRERSKILMVAVAPSPNLRAKIEEVADRYKRAFHQTSVGIVTTVACGEF